MGTSESCRKSWITRKKRYGSSGVKNLVDFKKNSSLGHMGSIPWNKGKKGTQVAWNKGLKSKTPIWNKGLTKETDERVLRVAMCKVGRKKPPVTEETRNKLSESKKGHTVSEKTREKISISNTGKHLTDKAKQVIGLKNSLAWSLKTDSEKEKINQKNRNSNLGKVCSVETIEKLRIASKEQWRTKRDQMLLSLLFVKNVKPNKFESKFLETCKENKINNIRYVGDGTFWITVPKEFRYLKFALNPDFIIEPFSKNKAIVETIGLHWHSDEDILLRKNIYEKLGIKYLFITDEQFKKHFIDTIKIVKEFVMDVSK